MTVIYCVADSLMR